MEAFFEEQFQKTGDVEFPDYSLAENPFPAEIDLTEGEGEDEDFCSLFWKLIHKKEINQVISKILKASKEGKKKFWLLKDDKYIPEHNISVVTGLFRALTICESPRLFPAYVPFPVIAQNPLGGILQWMVDRMNVDRFRLCVYAFAYNELKKLQESGTAAQMLPDIDVANLLKRMNETKGEAIDEILFVEEPKELRPKEPAEEEAAKEEGKESEASEGEEEVEQPEELSPEEIEAIRAEYEEKKRIAHELVLFVEGKIASSQFSPQIKAAMAVGITEGFEKGRSYLGVGEYRETLKGVLSLISLFYKNAVVIIDRLENWDILEETQQAAILGTLTELGWLFGQTGLLVMAGYERTAGVMGEEFAGTFEKISLNLWPVLLDLQAPLPADKANDLIAYFVQSDGLRKEKQEELKAAGVSDVHPFTDEGIEQLLESTEGNIGNFLIAAGKLLQAGKSKNVESIDADFVKNQGFVFD